MDEFIKVGIITSTHGLRGEVKVFPTTDDAKRFLDLEEIILDTGKGKRQLVIERVRFFKNMVILKFKGIDTIDDVQKFRQKELLVTRDQAVPLKENEYFIADLIGLLALSDEGEDLGTLAGVMQSATNDVYVIRKPGADDLLIPAIRECVRQVDLENGQITLHLLPGLREANQKKKKQE